MAADLCASWGFPIAPASSSTWSGGGTFAPEADMIGESQAETPLVSVCMTAYNHGRFIAQAIDSVLAQQAPFPYELVIGEDCSADDTRAIVLRYRDQHPDRIRVLLRQGNLGMHANGTDTLRQCRGTYIALLEGDDYWTSPHKLQRQVAYLEQHPACVECVHPVVVVDEEGVDLGQTFPAAPWRPNYSFEEMVAANLFGTCATMFRRSAFDAYPPWMFSMPYGDWAVHLWNARETPIACLDEPMAAYRRHMDGAWSSLPRQKRYRQSIAFLRTFAAHVPPSTRSLFWPYVAVRYEFLADDALETNASGARVRATRHLLSAAWFSPRSAPWLLRRIASTWLPRAYDRARRMKAAVRGRRSPAR